MDMLKFTKKFNLCPATLRGPCIDCRNSMCIHQIIINMKESQTLAITTMKGIYTVKLIEFKPYQKEETITNTTEGETNG